MKTHVARKLVRLVTFRGRLRVEFKEVHYKNKMFFFFRVFSAKYNKLNLLWTEIHQYRTCSISLTIFHKITQYLYLLIIAYFSITLA